MSCAWNSKKINENKLYINKLNRNIMKFKLIHTVLLTGMIACAPPQDRSEKQTDANTPLHLLRPDYPVPYGPPGEQHVAEVLSRVRDYLDATTPTGLVDRNTGQAITDPTVPDTAARMAPGDFRLVSYEWGVVYAGMLKAGAITDDPKYAAYVSERMKFLAQIIPVYRPLVEQGTMRAYAFRSIIAPHALDDAGSMCAAMIKSLQTGVDADLRPMVENFIDYIVNKQFRLSDGTLARNGPFPNTLWLDDLFMSVPALARMGSLTGDNKYFDMAVDQVVRFHDRMFVAEKGLFIHGWVEGMDPHPHYHWARANGWAIMAIVELLDVLPADHPARDQVLGILRTHMAGLARWQSGKGFWHQLLDRSDSYLETSATAIYTYSIAKAVNEGWVDPTVYSPVAILGWNAVTTRINDRGQVEGTCVGTGMAFDPAFYYYRPTSKFAAHGYGPVLLAGSEIIRMIRGHE